MSAFNRRFEPNLVMGVIPVSLIGCLPFLLGGLFAIQQAGFLIKWLGLVLLINAVLVLLYSFLGLKHGIIGRMYAENLKDRRATSFFL